MTTPTLSIQNLSSAKEQLEKMSENEFGASLEQVLSDSQSNLNILRIQRLAGLTVKEPYAVAELVGTRTSSSQAKYYWNWDNSLLREGQEKWQYKVIEQLSEDESEEINTFIAKTQSEGDLFSALWRSIKKYVCGDAKLNSKINAELAKMTPGGQVVTVDRLNHGAALALANALVSAVPVLKIAALGTAAGVGGAVLVYAIVLTIATIGLDAFCNSSNHVPEN